MKNKLSIVLIFIVLGVIQKISAQTPTYINEDHVKGQVFDRVYINEAFLENSLTFLRNLNPTKSLDTLEILFGNSQELLYYKTIVNLFDGDIFNAFQNISSYVELKNPLFKYEGYVLLAKVHFLRFTPELAHLAIDKAIRIEKKRPEAYLAKLMFYSNENRLDKCLEYSEYLFKKFPNQKEVFLYTGLAKITAYDTTGIDDINVFLANRDIPQLLRGKAYYGLAQHYNNQNDYQLAIKYSEKALEVYRDNFYLYGIIGECKFELGDMVGSLASLNKMEEFGATPYYLSFTARIHEYQGNLNKACAYYKRICTWTPTDNQSCSKISQLSCEN